MSTSKRSIAGHGLALAAFAAAILALPDQTPASEMAALAVEIGRTSVAMHHHAVNPRSIQPVRVIINHQGDVCHFQAIMVWRSGFFGAQVGSTPRRAVVYGTLLNRADLRRLYDLDYVEAPDRPCLGCDNAARTITYWNTRFARDDTLAPARELGQPLHRSMHPCPPCEVGCPADIPPVQGVVDPLSKRTSEDEVYEGESLSALIAGHGTRSRRQASNIQASMSVATGANDRDENALPTSSAESTTR
jgi:hypothetical protein